MHPRHLHLALPLLAFIPAATALAQATAPSPTQFAHQLFRLKQTDLIKAQLAASAGTPEESLWKAQSILAQFDTLSLDRADLPRLTDDYLHALRTYLSTAKTAQAPINGPWALDHGQFILTRLAQPVLTPMEYFSNSQRDRESLAPLATLADELLSISGTGYETSLKAIENTKPFDEKAYMLLYPGSVDLRFYAAGAAYAKAMSLDPATGGEPRKTLLKRAIDALADWAVDDTVNGKNHESYLLRGKAWAESGDTEKALADFSKAATPEAPDAVRFQAQYQSVVAHLRAGNIARARTSLENFRRSIPRENVEALRVTDLLTYRIAWSAAHAGPPADRATAERNAIELLSDLIEKDARYRDLVYEMLASQIPDDAPLEPLHPLQLLAVARLNSRGQAGTTPESRRRLELALKAANTLKQNPIARHADRQEAIFLSAVANSLLNNLAEAAADEITFAENSPSDPRARQMVDLALDHLAELRRQALAASQPLNPQIASLATRALTLLTDTYKDERRLFDRGLLLEEAGKKEEAAAIFERVKSDDRNYFAARHRLVLMAAEKFNALSQPAAQTPPARQVEAAQALFQACTTFAALLDNPPASATPEVIAAARAYRPSIWIIETLAAITPAVKQPQLALDRLDKLDAVRAQLTEPQKMAILRFRIQAYQMAGKPAETRQVVREYLKANPTSAMNDLRNMLLTAIAEIDAAEQADPTRAKSLAANVVEMLEPIIETAAAGPDGEKSDAAYEYRLTQAEMMTRAGQFREAQVVAVDLQRIRDADIRAYMTEARAMYAQAQAANDPRAMARTQDYFSRILARFAPGSEGFWECWLRVIQAMEAQGPSAAPEVKKRLTDLKGIYGTKFGGERFKADFARLAARYQLS